MAEFHTLCPKKAAGVTLRNSSTWQRGKLSNLRMGRFHSSDAQNTQIAICCAWCVIWLVINAKNMLKSWKGQSFLLRAPLESNAVTSENVPPPPQWGRTTRWCRGAAAPRPPRSSWTRRWPTSWTAGLGLGLLQRERSQGSRGPSKAMRPLWQYSELRCEFKGRNQQGSGGGACLNLWQDSPGVISWSQSERWGPSNGKVELLSPTVHHPQCTF